MFQFECKGRENPISQLKAFRQEESLYWGEKSVFLFCSGLQLIEWGPPTPRRAICFTEYTNLIVKLIQNTLLETIRVKFDQISEHHVIQSSWYIKLTITHTHTNTKLTITSQNLDTSKCPSTGEWINKLWASHTMEYCSAIKRNELLIHETTWGHLRALWWLKKSLFPKCTYWRCTVLEMAVMVLILIAVLISWCLHISNHHRHTLNTHSFNLSIILQ